MGKAEEIGKKALKLYKSLTDEHSIADESGVIKRLGQDWVALGLKYYPYQIMKLMSDISSEEVAAEGMYQFGYKCGKEICSRYISLGKEGRAAIEFTCAGATYFGWGAIEIIEFTEERGVARVYNSFEARSYFANNKRKSSVPQCNFFRGVMAGVGHTYWNREAKAKELKCIAMGDKYCEVEAVVV